MKNKIKYLLLLPLTFLVMSNSAAPQIFDRIETSYSSFTYDNFEKNEKNENGEYLFDPTYEYRVDINNYGDCFIGIEYYSNTYKILVDGKDQTVFAYGDVIVYPHETKQVYLDVYDIFEVEDVIKMEAQAFHLPSTHSNFVIQTIEYNHDENYSILTIDYANDFAKNYAKYVSFSYQFRNDETKETHYSTIEYSPSNTIRVMVEGIVLESDLINANVEIYYDNALNQSYFNGYDKAMFFLLLVYIVCLSAGILLIVGLIFLIIHLAKPKNKKEKVEKKENKEKKEKKKNKKEEIKEENKDEAKEDVIITTVSEDEIEIIDNPENHK